MKAVLSLLFCVAILGLSGGCGSTPTATVTAAAGIQVASVDAAMQAWGDYVRSVVATKPTPEKLNALQKDIDAVRSAYENYYAAARVEHDALASYVAFQGNSNVIGGGSTFNTWQAAASSLAASQTNVIALIQRLKNKNP